MLTRLTDPARVRAWLTIITFVAVTWYIRPIQRDIHETSVRVAQLEEFRAQHICINAQRSVSGLMLGGLFAWVCSMDQAITSLLAHDKALDLAIAKVQLDQHDLELKSLVQQLKLHHVRHRVNRVHAELMGLTSRMIDLDRVVTPVPFRYVTGEYVSTSIALTTDFNTRVSYLPCRYGFSSTDRHITDSGE